MKSLGFIRAAIFFALLPAAAAATPASAPPTPRERVAIAAASNLIYVVRDLVDAFRRTSPHVEITVATGASGTFVAQILQGAPFDIFLSADTAYPQALVAQDAAVAASLTTFARGKLVLWTTQPGLPLESVEHVVRDSTVRRIAIAHNQTAPYGRAAQQAMTKLGVWTVAQPKLVTGENITQTAQFVSSGNADAGFVALSLVLSPNLKERGRWIDVPETLHEPLDHAAVVTKCAQSHRAAFDFLAFLGSSEARDIFLRYGYGVPESPAKPSAPPPPER